MLGVGEDGQQHSQLINSNVGKAEVAKAPQSPRSQGVSTTEDPLHGTGGCQDATPQPGATGWCTGPGPSVSRKP